MKKLLMILTLNLVSSSYSIFLHKSMAGLGSLSFRSLAYRAIDCAGRACIGEAFLNNAKNAKIMLWASESSKEVEYWVKNQDGSWTKLKDQASLLAFLKNESKLT